MRLRLDFSRLKRVNQASGGSLSLCYQCGTCTASCLIAPSIKVRRVIRYAQLGSQPPEPGEVWKCLSCKYCDTRCPRGVEISRVMRSLKKELYESKQAPEKANEILWNVYESGNPLGSPRADRLAWTAGLKLDSNPDVVIYACCLAAYDKRLQNTLRSLVEVLKAAGLKVGVVGEGETCCGDVVYHIGEDYFLEELAQANAEALDKTGAPVIVTVSPHTYNMLTKIYPSLGAKLSAQVIPHVKYLAELLDDGRLKPSKPVGGAAVTYHDPCYLGRGAGIYEAPRRLLEAVPGVKLVEMEHNRERALCCGGGGGSIWMENTDARQVTRRRISEAMDTGAPVLATACPYCVRMLEDEAKLEGDTLRVMDVVEVIRESIK